MSVTRLLEGIFSTLFGLFFLLFRTRLSEFAIERWYKRFPEIKIWERGYYIGCYVLGIGFIVLGILTIAGIINIRK